LNNYGKNIILPSYEQLKTLLTFMYLIEKRNIYFS